MKNTFKLFLALIVLALLVGCGSTPVVKESTVYQFIKVPRELTNRVVLSRPPEPVYYSTLVWMIQEEILMNLIQARTTELGICNSRLGGVADWSTKQSMIYNGE